MAAPGERQEFAFNFRPDVPPDAEKAHGDVHDANQEDDIAAGEWEDFARCQEEHGSAVQEDWVEEEVAITGVEGDVILSKGRVTGSTAGQLLGDKSVEDNDLVPGVYEGGFKLWEGSSDLCRYLCKTYSLGASLMTSRDLDTPLQGKRVLELGCGHGLPGILCLLAGAHVHFQDYNSQVLQQLTMPNVTSNLSRLPPGRPLPSSRFFSGDWAYTGELLSSLGLGGHYDIILTSETIYNEEAQGRLLECIKQVLQPPHGVVYIASKMYYFGVGGGTKSFKKLVKQDGIFEVKSVATIEEAGSGVKREVLQMRFPEAIAPYFL